MNATAVVWGLSALVFVLVMTVTLAVLMNAKAKRRGRVLSIISGEGDAEHQV